MTYDELKRAMPWAGEHFLRANCEGESPELKRPVRRKPLAKSQAPASGGQRVSVRVVSYRKRLIDPDNLCAKAFIDCLRRAGLIADDTAAIMDYGISQERVSEEKEERTEIHLTKIQTEKVST